MEWIAEAGWGNLAQKFMTLVYNEQRLSVPM